MARPCDKPEGETYQMYLQAITNCGFCGKLCRKKEPECCDLARGLTEEQVTKLAEVFAERQRLYAKLADIACLSCEELSPTMRRVAARISLAEKTDSEKRSEET